MAIITILKHINWQSKQFIKDKKMRLNSFGRCFNMPHFLIKWQTLNEQIVFKYRTPLVNLRLLKIKVPYAPAPTLAEKAIRANPRTLFVSINTPLSKRAHSSSLVHSVREGIWRVINSSSLEASTCNVVSVFLSQAASLVPPAEVHRHLQACLDKQLDKDEGEIKQKQINAKNRQYFSVLFPFTAEKWNQHQTALRRFAATYSGSDNHFYFVCVCHHYKIYYSVQLKELRADLKDFRHMLQKFNFLKVITKIESCNERSAFSRCKQFVRILKWRTTESEDYLIFLLNQFGPNDMLLFLTLFEKVAGTYRLT